MVKVVLKRRLFYITICCFIIVVLSATASLRLDDLELAPGAMVEY